MKSNMKPSFSYSAYPLKAIEQAVASAKNGEPSPKLKALLSDDVNTRSRVRIHPMANAGKKILEALTARFKRTKDIEPDGKKWFMNYE